MVTDENLLGWSVGKSVPWHSGRQRVLRAKRQRTQKQKIMMDK